VQESRGEEKREEEKKEEEAMEEPIHKLLRTGNGGKECRMKKHGEDPIPGYDRILFTSERTKTNYAVHIRRFLRYTFPGKKVVPKGKLQAIRWQ
jgi:hypothetical protein